MTRSWSNERQQFVRYTDPLVTWSNLKLQDRTQTACVLPGFSSSAPGSQLLSGVLPSARGQLPRRWSLLALPSCPGMITTFKEPGYMEQWHVSPTPQTRLKLEDLLASFSYKPTHIAHVWWVHTTHMFSVFWDLLVIVTCRNLVVHDCFVTSQFVHVEQKLCWYSSTYNRTSWHWFKMGT